MVVVNVVKLYYSFIAKKESKHAVDQVISYYFCSFLVCGSFLFASSVCLSRHGVGTGRPGHIEGDGAQADDHDAYRWRIVLAVRDYAGFYQYPSKNQCTFAILLWGALFADLRTN